MMPTTTNTSAIAPSVEQFLADLRADEFDALSE